MIKIVRNRFEHNAFLKQYTVGSIERKIYDSMNFSSKVYAYEYADQLKFEIILRRNIVQAAKDLDASKFSFKTFRHAKCNPAFWQRTAEGGFMMRKDVKPSEAIKDIYTHGALYGTECATAIVIVYLKAVVDSFPEDLFTKLFSGIYLMTWEHLDSDLGIANYNSPADYLPGDCRYFKNPEVTRKTPEWQGENVIDLSDDTYYGHGMGIKTSAEIITALNGHRKSGATIEAHLLASVKRPNFIHLGNQHYEFTMGL